MSCRKAAFHATRLTLTVFRIVEFDDVFSEHPFIYVKLDPKVIAVIDTGCGGRSNDTDVDVKSLREFIETWPVDGNGGKPLNENGLVPYVVICTHCHYDHILGIEDFVSDSTIFASSHSSSFLDPQNRPQNTLCKKLGLKVPEYNLTLINDQVYIESGSTGINLQVLHTPGHTPDELAIWDEVEHMLYVGDTVYEWAPIIFPSEGDIKEWMESMAFLIEFVERKQHTTSQRVMINAGHETSMVDALDVLENGRSFISDVLSGKESVKEILILDGVEVVVYAHESGRFSLRCPKVLVEKWISSLHGNSRERAFEARMTTLAQNNAS